MESALKTYLDPILTRVFSAFERIWPLIRPAAHTRIAWAVTIAGLGLIVQPFWEPIVVALATKYLAIKVADLPGPAWGFSLVALALAYHLLAVRAQGLRDDLSAERVRTHDKPIVERTMVEFPAQAFNALIGSVGDDHSYRLPQNRLTEMADYLRDPANRLLDATLARSAEALAEQSARLGTFLATHFFVFGNSTPLRLVMYPDHNEDRTNRNLTAEDRQMYRDRSRELHALLDEAKAAHDDFVLKAHVRLA